MNELKKAIERVLEDFKPGSDMEFASDEINRTGKLLSIEHLREVYDAVKERL